MAAGTKDWLEVYQGDTFNKVLTWYDSSEKEVDLTGYTARMQLRTSADSDTVVLELTTENGGITLGGTAGTIELLVSATDMAAVEAGSYKYDLEMIAGDGTVRKILRGKIKVIAEVTRD